MIRFYMLIGSFVGLMTATWYFTHSYDIAQCSAKTASEHEKIAEAKSGQKDKAHEQDQKNVKTGQSIARNIEHVRNDTIKRLSNTAANSDRSGDVSASTCTARDIAQEAHIQAVIEAAYEIASVYCDWLNQWGGKCLVVGEADENIR